MYYAFRQSDDLRGSPLEALHLNGPDHTVSNEEAQENSLLPISTESAPLSTANTVVSVAIETLSAPDCDNGDNDWNVQVYEIEKQLEALNLNGSDHTIASSLSEGLISLRGLALKSEQSEKKIHFHRLREMVKPFLYEKKLPIAWPIGISALDSKQLAEKIGLNEEVMANMTGDSYIDGWKNSSGRGLEGSNLVDCSQALCSLIRAMRWNEENEEILTQLDEVSNAYSSLMKSENPQSFIAWTKNKQQQIDELKEGEELLLPFGYTLSKSGHTMLLLVIKEHRGLLLRVINSGDGIQHHLTREGDYNVFKSYRIPQSRLEEFFFIHFQPLFEPRYFGMSQQKAPYSVVELYRILDQYEIVPEEEEVKCPRRRQQAGTCVWRALTLFYDWKSCGDYEIYKFLFEMKTVELLLKKGAPNEVDCLFLERTIENLFRHLDKVLEKRLLSESEVERVQGRLILYQQKFREKEQARHAVGSASIPRSDTGERLEPNTEISSKIQALNESVVPLGMRSEKRVSILPLSLSRNLPLSLVSICQNLLPIIDCLEKNRYDFENPTASAHFAFASALESGRQLTLCFIDPQLEHQKKQLIAECQQDMEKCEEFCGLILALAYFISGHPLRYHDPLVSDLLLGLSIVLWEIGRATSKDERLIQEFDIHPPGKMKVSYNEIDLINPGTAGGDLVRLIAAWIQAHSQEPQEDNINISLSQNLGSTLNRDAYWLDNEHFLTSVHTEFLSEADRERMPSDKPSEAFRTLLYAKTLRPYLAALWLEIFREKFERTMIPPTFLSLGKLEKRKVKSDETLEVIQLGTIQIEHRLFEEKDHIGLYVSNQYSGKNNLCIERAEQLKAWQQMMVIDRENQLYAFFRSNEEVNTIQTITVPCLQMTTLFAFYAEHPEKLLEAKHQYIFSTLLIRAMSADLVVDELILTQANRFFLSTKVHAGVLAAILSREELDFLNAFILFHLFKIVTFHCVESVEQSRQALEKTLKNALDDALPRTTDQEALALLQTIWLERAAKNDLWDVDTLQKLPCYIQMFWNFCDSPYRPLCWFLVAPAMTAVAALSNRLKDFLASLEGADVLAQQWNLSSVERVVTDAFPRIILSIKDVEEKLELDALSGENLTTGMSRSGALSRIIRENAVYCSLFGNRSVSVCREKRGNDGMIYSLTDGCELIFAKDHSVQIERCFEGRPHRYLLRSELTLDKIPTAAQWHYWLSLGGESKTILVCNDNHEQIGMLDANGKFFLQESGISFHYLNVKQESQFFTLGASSYRSCSDQQGNSWEECFLPRFLIRNGKALGFRRERAEDLWKTDLDGDRLMAKIKPLGLQKSTVIVLLQANGKKIALLPNALKGTIHDQPLEKIPLEEIALTESCLPEIQRSLLGNLLIAYWAFLEARAPSDYLRLYPHLERARIFRPYSKQELLFLEAIVAFESGGEGKTQDKSPEGIAIRLLANLLIEENGNWFPESKREKKAESKNFSRELFLSDYYTKKGSLPEPLRLAITRQLEWLQRSEDQTEVVPKGVCLETLSNQQSCYLRVLWRLEKKNPHLHFPLCLSRPGDGYKYLFAYLSLAKTKPSELRQRIEMSQFEKAVYTIDRETQISSSTLTVFYYILSYAFENESSELQKAASSWFKLFERLVASNSLEQDRLLLSEMQMEEASFHRAYLAARKETISPNLWGGLQRNEKKRLSPQERLKIDLTRSDQFYAAILQCCKSLLLPNEKTGTFHAHPSSLLCQEPWLRSELEIGQTSRRRKEGASISIEELRRFSTHCPSVLLTIETFLETDRKALASIKQAILSLGVQKLSSDMHWRLKVASGKKRERTFDELILLAVRRSPDEIRKYTAFDANEQKQLIEAVGCFLQLHQRIHYLGELRALLQTALAANDSSNEAGLRLRGAKVQELLSNPPLLLEGEEGLAQLAFEYFLSIRLHTDQVSGLKAMLTEGASHFLQRATGAGKTLIFAQMMAFLLADRECLALHVSPIHQYGITLEEMQERSLQTFKQWEEPLIFCDTPEYCNIDGLEALLRRLKRAKNEKRFINTTLSSLRALRAAYVSRALELHAPKNEGKELGLVTSLRELLAFLRSSGHAVFDEVHEAQNPFFVYNKGVGHSMPISPAMLALIQELVIEAEQFQNQVIGLHKNQQAQITDQLCEKLLDSLADKLSRDPIRWKEWEAIFTQEELKQFFLKKRPLPPEVAELILGEDDAKKHFASLDLLLLCRELIGGKWVTDALKRSVYEHHAINRQTNSRELLPVSIPMLANRKPAKDSEFSDPFRMAINTYIAYLVEGLSPSQVKEWVILLRESAQVEWEMKLALNPSATLGETAAAQHFAETVQHDSSLKQELFAFSLDDSESIEKLRQLFNAPTPMAQNLMSEVVKTQVLEKKLLTQEQVSCNCMQTATMVHSISGFSATIDTKAIAPVMDVKGRRTTVDCQEGSYGERMALLIEKHQRVYVSGDTPEQFFSIAKGLDDRQNVRAIVDGGCFFRGIANQEVAQYFCNFLKEIASEALGVIFFDEERDQPFFMSKETPNQLTPISSFATKIIDGERVFSELKDLPVRRVAVYYNQDKATGTNIPLMEEAIFFSTMTEGTAFFAKIQADGRARSLETGQQVITVIAQGALPTIAERLDDPMIAKLPLGKVAETDKMIEKVILYTYCLRKEQRRIDNDQLLVQNLFNIVQQYLLDKIYENPLYEQEIFRCCPNLFKDNVAIDFIHDFALPPREEQMETYLKGVIVYLIDAITLLSFAGGDLESIRCLLQTTIQTDLLEGLSPTVQVNAKTGMGQQQNREATQVRLQQKQSVRLYERQAEQEAQETELRLHLTHSKVIPLKLFVSKRFGEQTLDPFKEYQTIFDQIKPQIEEEEGLNWGEELGYGYEELWDIKTDYLVELIQNEINMEGQSFTLLAIIENVLKNKKLKERLKATSYPCIALCDQHQLFTSSLLAFEGYYSLKGRQMDLFNQWQKKALYCLLIEDREEQCRRKVILLGAQEASSVHEYLSSIKQGTLSLPEGRCIWLIDRRGMNSGPETSPYDPSVLKDPNVSQALVEVAVLNGDFRMLSSPSWKEQWRQWLQGKNFQEVMALLEKMIPKNYWVAFQSSDCYSILEATTKP